VPTKTTDLAKGQVGYFNLLAENTSDFNSISTDDMDLQSVNNENPALVVLEYSDALSRHNANVLNFFLCFSLSTSIILSNQTPDLAKHQTSSFLFIMELGKICHNH
jgi:hypothetical protein